MNRWKSTAGSRMLHAMTEAIAGRADDAPLPAAGMLPRGGRVLIVRLSALGDVLFALETVAALRRDRPDVTIDFLVEDRFAKLLEGHPQIDRVIVYPRKQRSRIPGALWRLRRTRYDVALDLHGIQKSAMHLLACRARAKVGPAPPTSREGAALSYSEVVRVDLPHRADVGHALLAAIGLSGEPCAPTIATRPPAPELLADLPRPLVMLHPGTSSFAAFKRWPTERFAELATRLEGRGLGVVVGFGPGERELAAPALAAAPKSRAVDGAALGLAGLAGVMAECEVVVAADTGPLHLAAVVGARCVAVFGPKDPVRYAPRAHAERRHEVLFHDVPCRPCKRRTCASPQCVLGVDVDAVERAVLRQLGEPT